MRTPTQDREYNRGRTWAKQKSLAEIGTFVDAMVLGDYDWRDWFSDKPSSMFLAGAVDEAENRDRYEGMPAY